MLNKEKYLLTTKIILLALLSFNLFKTFVFINTMRISIYLTSLYCTFPNLTSISKSKILQNA